MATKFYRIIAGHIPEPSEDPGGPRIIVASEDTIQEISAEEAQRFLDGGSMATSAVARQMQ